MQFFPLLLAENYLQNFLTELLCCLYIENLDTFLKKYSSKYVCSSFFSELQVQWTKFRAFGISRNAKFRTQNFAKFAKFAIYNYLYNLSF